MTGFKLEWKPGLIRVAVIGQCVGDFGLRINRHNRVTVTHCPTGFTCGVFDDEITAKEYVAKIIMHPEWKDVRIDGDGTAHVPKDLSSFCASILHKMTAERTIV